MEEDILKDWQMAPIMIPTLCRYEHFKSCVESLRRCELSDRTDLYISLDYPLQESHWDGYRKIKDYLETGIIGFQNVFIYKQKKNLGAEKNWKFIHDIIRDKYNYYIGTEDDNVFSPNFLRYINEGLIKFIDDERIYAICGYSYPLEKFDKLNTYFLYPAFSAWGFGTWFGKEKLFVDSISNPTYPKRVLSSLPMVRKLMYESTSTLDNLITMTAMGLCHGDTLNETKIVTEGYKCLFPTLSKVRNTGHDGTGLHCGDDNKDLFNSQEIDHSNFLNLEMATYSQESECVHGFHTFKCTTRGGELKVWFKYIIYRLKLLFLLSHTKQIKSIIKHK